MADKRLGKDGKPKKKGIHPADGILQNLPIERINTDVVTSNPPLDISQLLADIQPMVQQAPAHINAPTAAPPSAADRGLLSNATGAGQGNTNDGSIFGRIKDVLGNLPIREGAEAIGLVAALSSGIPALAILPGLAMQNRRQSLLRKQGIEDEERQATRGQKDTLEQIRARAKAQGQQARGPAALKFQEQLIQKRHDVKNDGVPTFEEKEQIKARFKIGNDKALFDYKTEKSAKGGFPSVSNKDFLNNYNQFILATTGANAAFNQLDPGLAVTQAGYFEEFNRRFGSDTAGLTAMYQRAMREGLLSAAEFRPLLEQLRTLVAQKDNDIISQQEFDSLLASRKNELELALQERR